MGSHHKFEARDQAGRVEAMGTWQAYKRVSLYECLQTYTTILWSSWYRPFNLAAENLQVQTI